MTERMTQTITLATVEQVGFSISLEIDMEAATLETMLELLKDMCVTPAIVSRSLAIDRALRMAQIVPIILN